MPQAKRKQSKPPVMSGGLPVPTPVKTDDEYIREAQRARMDQVLAQEKDRADAEDRQRRSTISGVDVEGLREYDEMMADPERQRIMRDYFGPPRGVTEGVSMNVEKGPARPGDDIKLYDEKKKKKLR
jgi:hypothetical protein